VVGCAGGGEIEGVRKITDHPLGLVGGADDEARGERIRDAEIGGGADCLFERQIGKIADDGLVRQETRGFAQAIRLGVDEIGILKGVGGRIGRAVGFDSGNQAESGDHAHAGLQPHGIFSRGH